jgi:hypothetical protein
MGAISEGENAMKPCHEIKDVVVSDEALMLTIDGKGYQFQFSGISQRLKNASKAEREKFEISPSGYGIHWNLLDEDISIDGLLGIVHQLPSRLAA